MEDWKTKSNKMTMELNELKAQYKELENKVRRVYFELNSWCQYKELEKQVIEVWFKSIDCEGDFKVKACSEDLKYLDMNLKVLKVTFSTSNILSYVVLFTLMGGIFLQKLHWAKLMIQVEDAKEKYSLKE